MPATPRPSRRFIVALTAAVASTTLAIGVTATTLLGWVGPGGDATPSPAAPTEPPIVYVPGPAAPNPILVARAPDREDDDEHEYEREREHEHEHEHDYARTRHHADDDDGDDD